MKYLQFESIDEGPERSLLEEFGYEFEGYSFKFLTPEEARKARRGETELNINGEGAESLSNLAQKVRDHSVIEESYVSSYQKEKETQKLLEYIEEFQEDRHKAIDKAEEYWGAIEESLEVSNPEEKPERIFFPRNVELDTSGLEDLQFIEDIISDRYEVKNVSYIWNGIGKTEDISELESNINGNISVAIGDGNEDIREASEAILFDTPEERYIKCFNIDETARNLISQELNNRGFETEMSDGYIEIY